MGIPVGSKWKCTDEQREEFGLVGEVLSVEDHPDFNGDGGIEIQHEDGSILYMKVRRFVLRYELLKG